MKKCILTNVIKETNSSKKTLQIIIIKIALVISETTFRIRLEVLPNTAIINNRYIQFYFMPTLNLAILCTANIGVFFL